jgi:hypothetical protein
MADRGFGLLLVFGYAFDSGEFFIGDKGNDSIVTHHLLGQWWPAKGFLN